MATVTGDDADGTASKDDDVQGNCGGNNLKPEFVSKDGICGKIDDVPVEPTETKDNGSLEKVSVTPCINNASPVNGHGPESSESHEPNIGANEAVPKEDVGDVKESIPSVGEPGESDQQKGIVDESIVKEENVTPEDQELNKDGDQEDKEIPSDAEDEDPVENDDNFASIVSFFLCFGPTLGITYSISDLKHMIEDKRHVHNELIELHIKLLRKRRKYINKEKWEKSLIKFIHEYNPYDAWEMERFGYKFCKSKIKIQLLKRLLEAQFDYNLKFKSEINSVDSNNLRLKPLGRDVQGYTYWFQRDDEVNVRIYKEVFDEETSWELVSSDNEGMGKLLEHLKSHTSIEPMKESTNVSESEGEEETEEVVGSILEIKNEKLEENVKSEEDNNLLNCTEIKVAKITSEEIKPSNDSQESVTLSEEEIVGDVCNSMIDRVISSIDDNEEGIKESTVEESTTPIKSSPTKKSTRGRGRGRRSRGRGASRSTSRQSAAETKKEEPDQDSKSETPKVEPSKESTKPLTKEVPTIRAAVVTKATRNRGFGLSRELMELKSLAEQDLLDMERKANGIADGEPVVRKSRRVQVLQDKKAAEEAERAKREAERREAEAKKRKARQEELDRKRLEFQMNMESNGHDDSNSNSRSRSKKFKGCLETSSSDSEYEEASDQNDSSDNEDGEKKGKKKRRGRKGKKGSKYPWFDSSGSERHQATSEEEVEEEDEEVLKFDDNDYDEFACEEIEPDSEPVILKRARTAKKARSDSENDSGDEEVEDEEDALCKRCSKGDHPEWILLCDKCDVGFHTACCIPPLMIIPDGDWFCPPCENTMLIAKLEEELNETVHLLDKVDKEKLQKQRLKFVTVNEDNIIKTEKDELVEGVENDGITKSKSRKAPGHRSGGGGRSKSRTSHGSLSNDNTSDDDSGSSRSGSRTEGNSSDLSEGSDGFNLRARSRKKPINYQFKEYDDLINSAIRADDYVEEQGDAVEEEEEDDVPNEEEEDEEDTGRNYGKGKDIETIVMAAKEAEAKERRLSQVGLEGEEGQIPIVAIEFLDQEKTTETDAVAENVSEEVEEEEDTAKKGKKGKRPVKKRRLNDLDSPVDDDDSDESFKGSSGTEVEEDFAPSNDDTEENNSNESDDSDFREFRRKSRRSVKRSSSSRRSSGRKKKGSKRYKRDEFVIDSDEDELESYGRKGRKTRTRNQGSKRKIYKEETTDEETEEEEEWVADDSPKPAKKKGEGKKSKKDGDEDEEESDVEWGSKKGRKRKKSWGASDEDFEGEDDDEDEDNETEEDEDDKKEAGDEDSEQVTGKLVQVDNDPTQLPMIEEQDAMAAVTSLDVLPSDENMILPPEVPSGPIVPVKVDSKNQSKSPKRKPAKVKGRRSGSKEGKEKKESKRGRKKSKKGEGEENEAGEGEIIEKKPKKERKKKEPRESGKLEMRGKPRLSKARIMSLKEQDSNDEEDEPIPQIEEMNVPLEADGKTQESNVTGDVPPPPPLLSRPSMESPLITAALTSGLPPNLGQHQPSPHHGQGPQSALSQLTAFASRGPGPHPPPPGHHAPTGPPPPGYHPPSFGPPHGHPHIPPPLVSSSGGLSPMPPRSSRPPPGPYGINPMDPYSAHPPVGKPLKPAADEQYPPPATSPPKMHNMDSRPPGPSSHGPPTSAPGSGHPPRHPGMVHPPPPPGYGDPLRYPGPPPPHGYDPRMRTPPGFDPRDPYSRDQPPQMGYPGSAHMPYPMHGYPSGPRGYPGYPPPGSGHGYSGPPGPSPLPSQASSAHRREPPPPSPSSSRSSAHPSDPGANYKTSQAPGPSPPATAPLGHGPPMYPTGPPGYPHHYPGYPPPPHHHPGFGQDPYGRPIPNSQHLGHHQGPPLPPYGSPYGPPPPGNPHYNPYAYGQQQQQPGAGPPNGFMIQNLLQNNPGPPSASPRPTPSESKSNPGSASGLDEPTLPTGRGRGRGRGSRGSRGSRRGSTSSNGSGGPPPTATTPPYPAQ